MRCVGADPTGQHCCTFADGVCKFYDDGCTLHDKWGTLKDMPEWVAAPVGQWFTAQHPGYECEDWPQNIPAVMNNPTKPKCCYG